MEKAREDAREYLTSLTREQFVSMLTKAGFEVSDGPGQIIFTGEKTEDITFSISSSWKSKSNTLCVCLAYGYPMAS